MCFLACVFAFPTLAASDGLDTALENARAACGGISSELVELKKMAGINTAVTGVGTAVGVGATTVGIVKAQKDKELAEMERQQAVAELDAMGAKRITSEVELLDKLSKIFVQSGEPEYVEMGNVLQARYEKLNKQSKSLGNWRTGLLATNTVTNVAGAAIASGNQVDEDLDARIARCVASVDALRMAYGAARAENADSEMVAVAENVISKCSEWETADLTPINKRARGAAIASSVGAGVGLTGTIVSALANSNKVRVNNTDAGQKKEKGLNTAANVMAGGATAASGTAVVFNATQIGAVKRIVEIADNCEGAL